MARGFKPEARVPKSDTGYKTIFEKVVEEAEGEKKSYNWYRNTIERLTNDLNVIVDESRDRAGTDEQQDNNTLRIDPLQGHLMFFDYDAKSNLPYFDRFPLAYVLTGQNSTEFYAANLHYINPKDRVYIINDLKKGKINIPKNIIHKYLRSQVKSLFLDLATEEWETSILLPVESFVTTKKTGSMSYNSKDVWKEISDSKSEKLKGIAKVKKV